VKKQLPVRTQLVRLSESEIELVRCFRLCDEEHQEYVHRFTVEASARSGRRRPKNIIPFRHR
jgi:hypothetical protein